MTPSDVFLPPEIWVLILGNLDSYDDIQSCIQASPFLLKLYLSHRERTLRHITENSIGDPRALSDALAIVRWPTFTPSDDDDDSSLRSSIEAHLGEYTQSTRKDAVSADFHSIRRLNKTVTEFIFDFANKAKSPNPESAHWKVPYWSHPSFPISPLSDTKLLSTRELISFKRAFLRYELFARAFHIRLGQPLFSAVDQRTLLDGLSKCDGDRIWAVYRYVRMQFTTLRRQIKTDFCDEIQEAKCKPVAPERRGVASMFDLEEFESSPTRVHAIMDEDLPCFTQLDEPQVFDDTLSSFGICYLADILYSTKDRYREIVQRSYRQHASRGLRRHAFLESALQEWYTFIKVSPEEQKAKQFSQRPWSSSWGRKVNKERCLALRGQAFFDTVSTLPVPRNPEHPPVPCKPTPTELPLNVLIPIIGRYSNYHCHQTLPHRILAHDGVGHYEIRREWLGKRQGVMF